MTEPVLRDHQFSLSGLLLGWPGPINVSKFDSGGATVRGQDTDDPAGDVRIYGRDLKSPATWTFEMEVMRRDEAGALETLAALASVWDAPGVRGQSREVLPLRYAIGGRTRLVYGRPRRFDAPPDTTIRQGRILVTADFPLTDLFHYSDVEQSMSSDLTGSTNPFGLSVPITWPISWASGTYVADSRTAIVGGDRPTWPVLEFRGGSRPRAEMAGWSCQPLVDLNWDETVVVDTRPWVRSATLNGGSVPLARGTFLEDMSLPPGGHPVRYSSGPSNGQPSVTVRWRDAYISL